MKIRWDKPGEEKEKGGSHVGGTSINAQRAERIFIYLCIPALIYFSGVPQSPCWTQPILGNKGLCESRPTLVELFPDEGDMANKVNA